MPRLQNAETDNGPSIESKFSDDSSRTSRAGARKAFGRPSSGSGALRPPPPVVAPLVPRCALLPAATPRDVLSALGTLFQADRIGTRTVCGGRRPTKRGWWAGGSGQPAYE